VKQLGRTVWVAMRVPDDMICGHANQSRITTFMPAKKEKAGQETVLWSKNVVSYARLMGWYDGKNDRDFSYNAAYAKPDFSGRRICDARVWQFFNRYADNMDRYIPWAEGNDANAEHRGNDAEGLAQVGHGRKIAIAHRAQRDGSPVESIKKILEDVFSSHGVNLLFRLEHEDGSDEDVEKSHDQDGQQHFPLLFDHRDQKTQWLEIIDYLRETNYLEQADGLGQFEGRIQQGEGGQDGQEVEDGYRSERIDEESLPFLTVGAKIAGHPTEDIVHHIDDT
jgi:hypothetical protein